MVAGWASRWAATSFILGLRVDRRGARLYIRSMSSGAVRAPQRPSSSTTVLFGPAMVADADRAGSTLLVFDLAALRRRRFEHLCVRQPSHSTCELSSTLRQVDVSAHR